MSPNFVILAAASVGMIVNTLAVLAVAWRGGQVLGRMTGTMESLQEEVSILRRTRDEHATLLARTVAQLDDVERRVERLEGR